MSDWRDKLNNKFNKISEQKRQEAAELPRQQELAAQWIKETVVPAFHEVQPEIEKHGRKVIINSNQTRATILVTMHGSIELDYQIIAEVHPAGVNAVTSIGYSGGRSRGSPRGGAQGYHASTVTKEEIIADILMHYNPT
jgi:hypothetical protein